MHRLAIAASVAVMAAIFTGCANEQSSSSGSLLPSPSILAPSTVDGDALRVGSEAKGGNRIPGGGGTTGGGSGSLTLKMVTDLNGNGAPNWGDSITWVVSTNATTEPNVSVACYQGGKLVYSAGTGYYPSYPWPSTQIMTLSSQNWTSGAASCTATLSYINGTSSVTISTTSFNVGA